MPLEDHVGDILRKARWHTGVSVERLAKVAGLSPQQLEEIEADGVVRWPVDYASVGGLLGLHAEKLKQIANGWEPAPVNLARWRHLRALATGTAGFSVNSYLVWDEGTSEAVLFDAGINAEPVLRLLREHCLVLRCVFLTHAHQDHTAAWPQVQAACPDAKRWPEPATAAIASPARLFTIGRFTIAVRDTPGHTEDGVTYVVSGWPEQAPIVAVVGDALFAGSMGKAPGRAELARARIREQILSLPPSTLICPGHGPLTTVAEELAHNPFF